MSSIAKAKLIEGRGEVVSRESLRLAIWGTETSVDFDRGLDFCIAQIRSALGDSAESPRFVRTVPKRGYRFIAPLQGGSRIRVLALIRMPERAHTSPVLLHSGCCCLGAADQRFIIVLIGPTGAGKREM